MPQDSPTLGDMRDLLEMSWEEMATAIGWLGNTLCKYREHPLDAHPDVLPGLWKAVKQRAGNLALVSAIVIPRLEAKFEQENELQNEFMEWRKELSRSVCSSPEKPLGRLIRCGGMRVAPARRRRYRYGGCGETPVLPRRRYRRDAGATDMQGEQS